VRLADFLCEVVRRDEENGHGSMFGHQRSSRTTLTLQLISDTCVQVQL